MWNSVLTMIIVGLAAGFIFSMPVAGPISILVTSNALKGRVRYCNLVAIGASFADLVYVFLAVFGITRLYKFIVPAMPYILAGGAFFLFFIGYKVYRTKIDLEHLPEGGDGKGIAYRQGHGGFYTGFMVNFLNPTLIFGWLTTSVLVITFISSLGFNTGGLDSMINKNVTEINGLDKHMIRDSTVPSYFRPDTLKFLKRHPAREESVHPVWFPAVISFSYACAVAVGSIAWFLLLTLILSHLRYRINLNIIRWIVKGLGIILCLFGVYFAYSAIVLLI